MGWFCTMLKPLVACLFTKHTSIQRKQFICFNNKMITTNTMDLTGTYVTSAQHQLHFFQWKFWTFFDRAFNRNDFFKFMFAINVGLFWLLLFFVSNLALEPSSSLAADTLLTQISWLLSIILTELEGGNTGGVFSLVANGLLYPNK